MRSPVYRNAILVSLAWTAVMALSLAWQVAEEKRQALTLATSAAHANFNKDQAYRNWASKHGGVYVQPDERTPPSPYLAHIADRDVVTTGGKQLTLMNPAYMLRQMMDEYGQLYGIRGRIVGIVYLNPNNEADAWEAQTIREFEQGAKEKVELTEIDGAPYIRLMKPMVMKQHCQKCHGHLGFANGQVRGGVSVSVPMAPYNDSATHGIQIAAVNHMGIWLLGLAGVWGVGWRSQLSYRERERHVNDLLLSSHVFEYSQEAMLVTDSQARILSVNSAFTRHTGFSEEEAVGRTPSLLKSDHHDPMFYAQMWQELLTNGSWQGEIWNRRKGGEVFAAWETIVMVRNPQGEITHFIGAFTDITEKKQWEERIHHLAHFDVLTELPNRALFNDRLEHALAGAKRENRRMALMFLDLDGFKRVNDSLGHAHGDLLLQEVSCRLTRCVRNADTLARLGGDEFVVLLEHVQEEGDVRLVAEKVLRALREPVILDGRHEVFVSGSLGVALYPDDGNDVRALLKNADTAMYQAKDSGKDCIVFYQPEMSDLATVRLTYESDLRRALRERQLQAYYQPKFDLSQQKIVGFEALARWIHPEKGMISPGVFIPLAEELNMIDQIDAAIMAQAVKDAMSWRQAGYDLVVSVNVSGRELERGDELAQRVEVLLEQYALPPQNLQIEITESVLMELTERVQQALNALRGLGVSVAIDDFGTGYSSLSYLKNLSVDVIKIDQSFVREITRVREDQVIVRAVIAMAESMGLSVLAEGVEAEEQCRFLRKEGCHQIQGYWISRPTPLEETFPLLREYDNLQRLKA
ncbi:EAL domain-containing protein [Magnetofaba australis]|uniref:Putative signal transduction protein n=1 Tax=Magnetofaba australis IT-1 TaxID=1434232 RepID=A0A1Y2K1C7_9PROT|nr:EAL domain-containing protein [Magnetofaba australis]OSM01841.1 putative signal transduction protein [Magnetofaba australis IT-1]